MEPHSWKEPLSPAMVVDKCESAHDVSQMFVPTGDLWRKRSCLDFDVHGPTVGADGAFRLLRRPAKSQSLRQEVRACQDQPMMSWERKWVGPNVPRVIFMKVFRAARWNKGSKLSHWRGAHANISNRTRCRFNRRRSPTATGFSDHLYLKPCHLQCCIN